MSIPEPKVTLQDITDRLYAALADLATCDEQEYPFKAQALLDTIEGIEGEMSFKIARILAFQEHVDENATVAEAHRKHYADKAAFWSKKRRMYESIRDNLTAYIIRCMKAVGITKQFQAGDVKLTIKGGDESKPNKVEITDLCALPDKYFKRTLEEVKLSEVKEDLKNGVLVPGAKLVPGKESLVIS